MFSLPWIRRGPDPMLIESALANLSAWATREWPPHWELQSSLGTLGEALDLFLPDGLEEARKEAHLHTTSDARIARALLIGIGRSATHPIPEMEAALGVPFPPEAHPP